MGRFVVVLPLAPLVAGDGFAVADWPLHVTLVEPFETDAPPEALAAALEPVAAGTSVIRTTAGADARFGRRHDVPVSLVRDDGALSALRGAALEVLLGMGVALPRARPDYRPHVSAKRHGRLRAGDRVVLDRLTLVDMRPAQGGPAREVVASLPLTAPGTAR